jgi:hypothetical protein
LNIDTAKNPWARPNKIIKNINANIDVEGIETVAKNISEQSMDPKRKLKGIYFDNDVADALDLLKKKRINVSGFVNDAVRHWLAQ